MKQYKGFECGKCGTRFDNLSTSWPCCYNCGWAQYVYILQWTPFPGQWEHLPEWQLQTAEWDLRLGKRHYYEHAIRTNNGLLYPVEIANQIIEYWSKRRAWAKYQTERPNNAVAADRTDSVDNDTPAGGG